MEAVGAPVASVKRWETGDIGNPHVVCEVDDPDEIDLALAGPAIEAHFDDGANVHFVSVSGTDEISLRAGSEVPASPTPAAPAPPSRPTSSIAGVWSIAR